MCSHSIDCWLYGAGASLSYIRQNFNYQRHFNIDTKTLYMYIYIYIYIVHKYLAGTRCKYGPHNPQPIHIKFDQFLHHFSEYIEMLNHPFWSQIPSCNTYFIWFMICIIYNFGQVPLLYNLCQHITSVLMRDVSQESIALSGVSILFVHCCLACLEFTWKINSKQ